MVDKNFDAITMLAYLGLRCGFVGKRGDDCLGKVFDEEMNDDRIDLSCAMSLRGARTSLAWIQVKEDGVRCHVIIPMSEKGMLKTAEMDERRGHLKSLRAGARNMPRSREVEKFVKSKGWAGIS